MTIRLREWLAERPFSLAMSAGFFGFFAHAGALTALEDEGLLPARTSGASAGALVTGVWASGVDGKRIADILLSLRREDFWDPRLGAGFLRGKLFRDKLEEILPAKTFAECRVPLAVSAYDVFARKVRPLAEGELAPAIQASCAVPFMFHPVWIEGRAYLDGGVTDRPGLSGMPAGDRVLFHHLASRSPWRRRGSPSMKVPSRADASLTAVVIEDIPRVGPFRLHEGARAFEAGRRGMKRALDRTIPEGSLVLG